MRCTCRNTTTNVMLMHVSSHWLIQTNTCGYDYSLHWILFDIASNVKLPENLHPIFTPTDAFLFQTPHSRHVTRPVKRVWAKFTSRPLKGINYTLELTAIFLCFLHDQTGPHLLQRIDLNKKEMKSCWANFYFFFVGQEGQQPPQESIKTHAGKQLKLHQP